jgi:cytochrome c-type biogenesis protein CcmH/NrfF
MTTSYWLLWTWVAGVVVLALVIAYGIRKTGRRSRQQRAVVNRRGVPTPIGKLSY